MPKHKPKKTRECAEFERVVDFQIEGLQDDLRDKDLEIARLKAEVAGLRLALAAPRYYPVRVPYQPYSPYPYITSGGTITVNSTATTLRVLPPPDEAAS